LRLLKWQKTDRNGQVRAYEVRHHHRGRDTQHRSDQGLLLYLFSNEPYYCNYIYFLGDVKAVNGHVHRVVEVPAFSKDYNQFFVGGYNSDTGYPDTSLYVSI
jgi:hypothetical protein